MIGPIPSARAHRLVGPILFALAALALAGCAATPQSRALRTDPPPDLPARAELERVPFFAQERYQCGPAALAMALNDAGENATPESLVHEVYIPEREGTLRTEIRTAVRARGLVAYPLEPRLEALLRELAAGRPVLVMQNLGLDWLPQWHFAVAVGYDLEAREIVLRSGTMRRRVTPLATFERTWARADRWAQVIVPPTAPPATANALAWLTATNELEWVGNRERALVGYRAATARWPDSAAAWMLRGNGAYEMDSFSEARAAFGKAVALEPGQPGAWNNYAYALAATGCSDAARSAAQCAVRLDPEDAEARDTLHEIEAMTESIGSGQCSIPVCPVGEPGTTK